MRPFTFLVDDYTATNAVELGERARHAEALGATTFVIPDHLVPMMAPIPYLATVAAATVERYGIGPISGTRWSGMTNVVAPSASAARARSPSSAAVVAV